jgi:large subunit ribosomal protein L13
MMTAKTYSPKPSELTHEWYIVDATDQVLGRLAAELAQVLIGKHKPQYSPHLDCGDNIVVINAEKIKITGNKLEDKKYYHHSGYPGGIKETNLARLLTEKPTSALERAVKGMLPKNRLQDDRLARLKLYEGSEHPHAPQSPKVLEFK